MLPALFARRSEAGSPIFSWGFFVCGWNDFDASWIEKQYREDEWAAHERAACIRGSMREGASDNSGWRDAADFGGHGTRCANDSATSAICANEYGSRKSRGAIGGER
jgi:hypothetical protein